MLDNVLCQIIFVSSAVHFSLNVGLGLVLNLKGALSLSFGLGVRETEFWIQVWLLLVARFRFYATKVEFSKESEVKT